MIPIGFGVSRRRLVLPALSITRTSSWFMTWASRAVYAEPGYLLFARGSILMAQSFDLRTSARPATQLRSQKTCCTFATLVSLIFLWQRVES
jgi:hypothetical protein